MCENLLAEALRRADDDLMVFGTGVLELRDGNVRHVPLSDIWLDTDAELMTKAEIIMRRMEAIANHSYHIDGEVSASSLRDYDEAMRMALTPVEPEKFIYREQVYIPGVGVF